MKERRYKQIAHPLQCCRWTAIAHNSQEQIVRKESHIQLKWHREFGKAERNYLRWNFIRMIRLYQGNINDQFRASFEVGKLDSGIVMHSKDSGRRAQRDFSFPASPSLCTEIQCAPFEVFFPSQRSPLQYLSNRPERAWTCQAGHKKNLVMKQS